MTEVSIRSLARPVGLVLLLTAVSGCGLETGGEVAVTKTQLPTVSAVQVRSVTLHPELELVARTVPKPECVARVASRVAGTVVEIGVVEGCRVHAGDTLLVIDPTLFQIEVDRSAAVVEQRRAALDLFEHGPLPEQLDMAREELHRTEAAAESTALKLKALDELATHSTLSPVRLAEARASRKSADAEVAGARAALALLEAGTRPERVREARALLATAEAMLAGARARLRFSVIEAPFDGTVTRVEARIGSRVDAGTFVVEVSDLSTLLLEARLPAKALPELDLEGACSAEFDVLRAALEGSIDRFGATAESGTGGVWVYVAVSNPAELLAGMTGSVRFPMLAIEGATVVPVAAVAERSGTPVATVVREDEAYEVEVGIGARAEGWIQVLEGLAAGEWVAIEGGYGLPDGQRVVVLRGTGEEPR